MWFGQNQSGLDNATQMALEAKHQIVGWGWQQNFRTVAKYTSNDTTGALPFPNLSVRRRRRGAGV